MLETTKSRTRDLQNGIAQRSLKFFMSTRLSPAAEPRDWLLIL